MKEFTIKSSYKNGYQIHKVKAKSFASACIIIEKSDAKRLMYPQSFIIVDSYNN